MKKVIIYSKPTCTFCVKAKEYLDQRGIVYEDRVIGLRYTADELRSHCTSLKEGVEIRTVPQIILVQDNGEELYIGGYNELVKYGL